MATIQPAAEKRSFYNIKQDEDARHAEILIYDEIASGCIADVLGLVSAKRFVSDLMALDVDTITLRINSPGGDVFDGVAIYNALRDHDARVSVKVDGLAASIASVIMLAGDERHVGIGAKVMIHNPWCMTMGESSDMRKTADLLDDIRDGILDVYVDRTGADRDELAAAMGAETWFSSKDALAMGFATAVDESVDSEVAVRNIARFDERVAARHRYENTPATVKLALQARNADEAVASLHPAYADAEPSSPSLPTAADSSAAPTVPSDKESDAHNRRVRELLTAR